MMRGPTYDDGYITRKLASLQTSPTFLPPAPARRPHYLQSLYKYRPKRKTYNYRISLFPGFGRRETRYFPIPRCRSLSPLRSRSLSPEPRSSPVRDFNTPARGYIPSAQTQLILNRISVNPRDYPPLNVPRVAPRMPPPYYDYDYGYGAYGGYGGYYDNYGYYPPARPRMSRYDAYLDDDIDVSPPVSYPRYSRATRLADQIVEAEKEKLIDTLRQSPVRTTKTTTYTLPQFTHTRNVSQRMLQDEVDNIRTRLKGLSYSIDPSGPVPDIITPERGRRATSVENARRYTSGPKHLACVEFAGGVPQWKRKARSSFRYPSEVPEVETSAYETTRAVATDPEKLLLKDRLSMRIHTFLGDTMDDEKFGRYLKSYRDPAMPPPTSQWRQEYYKPRLYKAGVDGLGSTYSSKFPTKSKAGGTETKWEEPDTIYSAKDKQPYSKVETGSSIFSTHGFTNCKRDTIAEKVSDYYYLGDKNQKEHSTVKLVEPLKKTTETEEDDTKKERRKKKKSREDMSLSEPTSAPASEDHAPAKDTALEAVSAPESTTEPVAAQAAEGAGETAPPEVEPELDDKEKKKLEKKKRKAEREAAAKAAMEAELAALAAAEAELAQLEAQEATLSTEPVTDPAPTQEASEEKCEFVNDIKDAAIPEPTTSSEPEPSLSQTHQKALDETVDNTQIVDKQQDNTETTNESLDNTSNLALDTQEISSEPIQDTKPTHEYELTQEPESVQEPETVVVPDTTQEETIEPEAAQEPELTKESEISETPQEAEVFSEEPVYSKETTEVDEPEEISETPAQISSFIDVPADDASVDQDPVVDDVSVGEPAAETALVENTVDDASQNEYTDEAPDKTYKQESTFDWGDFDDDGQQIGGTGGGESGGVETDVDNVFEPAEDA